jgi:hypothetical protein
MPRSVWCFELDDPSRTIQQYPMQIPAHIQHDDLEANCRQTPNLVEPPIFLERHSPSFAHASKASRPAALASLPARNVSCGPLSNPQTRRPTGSSSFACIVKRDGIGGGGGFVKPYLHMFDAPSRGSDVFISLFRCRSSGSSVQVVFHRVTSMAEDC